MRARVVSLLWLVVRTATCARARRSITAALPALLLAVTASQAGSSSPAVVDRQESAATADPAATPREYADALIVRPDLARYFSSAGTVGTIVVRDVETRRMTIVNPERAERGYAPSSTFKIPNTLIALQEGIVASADHIFRGPHPRFLVDGKPLLPTACDGTISLRAAFRNSCIPVFQQIARDVGAERYQRYLRDWAYGNTRMGGTTLDRFWLQGELKISALEQVDFLTRLATGDPPATRAALERLEEVMATERTGQYLILAKSGYVFTTEPRVGWYVGWVERAGAPAIFALNLDMTQPAHAAARVAITRAVLAELQVL